VRDHEDLSALEVLILALMLDDETSAEEVTANKPDAQTPPVDTQRTRSERGQ
jgi:hypothetical protein